MDDTTNNKGMALIHINHELFAKSPELQLQKLSQNWLAKIQVEYTADLTHIKSIKDSLLQLGQLEQQAFWQTNNRLKQPLEKLMRDAEGGGQSTQWLHTLQLTLVKIKPPKKTFFGGFFNMFKLLFSLKNSAWEMWMEAYPEHKQQILKITGQLESHKKKLQRDNAMLLTSKEGLAQQTEELTHAVDLACHLEKALSEEIGNNQQLNSTTKELYSDELLPVIQKRTIELQQQLLIARQSVMTLELFIVQNETQIRGIEQSAHTTTAAMDVTASLYMLEQANKLTAQVGGQAKNDSANKIDGQKLKQARHLIDKALIDMEAAQSGSEVKDDAVVESAK